MLTSEVTNARAIPLEVVRTPTPISRDSFSLLIYCENQHGVSSYPLDDPKLLNLVVNKLATVQDVHHLIFFEGIWRKIPTTPLVPLVDLLRKMRHFLSELNSSWMQKMVEDDPIRLLCDLISFKMVSANRSSVRLTAELEKHPLTKKIILSPSMQLMKNNDLYGSLLRKPASIFAPEGYKTRKVREYLADIYAFDVYSTSLGENLLEAYPKFLDKRFESLTKEVSAFLGATVEQAEIFGNTDSVLKARLNRAQKFLKARIVKGDTIPPEVHNTIVKLGAFQSLRLHNIAPYLLDPEIEEIFVDGPLSPIYVDHEEFGRCITPVYLDYDELEAFHTRCRLESGNRLDEVNPSLKTEIVTESFHVRASIDIAPLNINHSSISIRKLKKRTFSITELIGNRTLSSEAAAQLIQKLYERKNIGVVGEPGSGKTTLANALLELSPRNWRTIFLEDVVETEDLHKLGLHQVRYKVDPLESQLRNSTTKKREIIKMLHRSPSYVFLGEIQTREHSEALFNALAAGLKTIFTVHASNIGQLMRRWILQHEIDPAAIRDLDLLALVRRMSYSSGKRRVIKVGEIVHSSSPFYVGSRSRYRDLPAVRTLYAYSKISDCLIKHEAPNSQNQAATTMFPVKSKAEELNMLSSLLQELAYQKVFDILRVREKIEGVIHDFESADLAL